MMVIKKGKKLDLLKNELCKHNILMSDEQEEKLITYYEMLVEKNQVMNLTAITDFYEVEIKHFIDSISLAFYIDMNNVSNMIDIGTGAGFPGMPLKIIFPHLNIVLADSLGKRIEFLNDVCKALSLDDVSCIHMRAEDLGRNELYRERFDICVSRAVTKLNVLSEYCLPLVRCGGTFVSYKSGGCSEEISESGRAIEVLGGKIASVKNFDLASADIKRSFVFVEKIRKTDLKYPRKAGIPSKKPII